MAKYIDPFTDTGFKIVFGLNNVSNEILKYFLKAVYTSYTPKNCGAAD